MGAIAEAIVAYAQPLIDETDGSTEQMNKALTWAVKKLVLTRVFEGVILFLFSDGFYSLFAPSRMQHGQSA